MGTRRIDFKFFAHTLPNTNTSRYNFTARTLFFPTVLIKEGKIDYHELSKIKHSEQWLMSQLKFYNLEIKDVLLATMDQKDNLHVFRY